MLKSVIFVSQREAEMRSGWPDWSIISITGTAFYPANLQPGWRNVLRLVFDDVDVEGGEYQAITDEQANELVDFVINESESGEVTGILVHCSAGISRSAGVARWIARAYNLPFNERYQNDNRLVYSKLLNASMYRDTVSWAGSPNTNPADLFVLYSTGQLPREKLKELTGITMDKSINEEMARRNLKLPIEE